jgi:hypothetical protein
MSSIENFQLHLSSNFADKIYSNNNADTEFYLPLIEIPSQYHLHINVVHASIPFTFYNINSSNNVLNYSIEGTNYSFIIAQDNYNVVNLKDYLMSNLPGFIITYSPITNKYTFMQDYYGFSFLNTSTCLNILGFSQQTITSNGTSLTSTQSVNLNPIRCVCICSDLPSSNISLNSKNKNNILCSIPITTQPNSIITYLNHNNFKINTYANVLSSIRIQLMDQDGNLLNLNGTNWSMTIQFDVIDFVDDNPIH